MSDRSDRLTARRPRRDDSIVEARREVEERLADLRAAVQRELHWLPTGRAWTLPLIGLACGIALALRRR